MTARGSGTLEVRVGIAMMAAGLAFLAAAVYLVYSSKTLAGLLAAAVGFTIVGVGENLVKS